MIARCRQIFNQCIDSLRASFSQASSESLRRDSRLLVRQIQSSLQLQPVALAVEAISALGLLFLMWEVENHAFLITWFVFVGMHIYASLEFTRRFWADRHRHARIALWVRTWMVIAGGAGLIWAVAGAFFSISHASLTFELVLMLSLILSVTFVSWPIYACWLPSLFVFTLLSVTPLILRLAFMFGVSRMAIALVLVAVMLFIFYSGRRFNDIVKMAVRNDQENAQLVKRLTLEKKLADRVRREIEERSRKHGRFFAAANHDIRQPLQAIGIYMQLLQRVQDPQMKAVVEQLGKTTHTLQSLVGQILEVSRLEMGNMTVEAKPVHLKSLLEDLAFEFEPLAHQRGLGFRLKNLDVIVHTDPQLLMRALRNLLNNALSYTKEGEIVLAARLLGQKRVSICVVDSGLGIAKADQKRIFESFYRAETTKNTTEGYGLGLSIVRIIGQLLDLRVSLGSRVGRGSIFRLELPVHEQQQAEIFTRAHLTKSTFKTLPATIVLIEDNAIVRESLKVLLESWGARVIASDYLDDETVEAIRSATLVHAILCDFNLGDDRLTGLQLIPAITRLIGYRVPSILLTAVSTDEIQAQYIRELALLNAQEAALFAMPQILQKPASGETLNAALHAAVTEAEVRIAKKS